VKDLWGRIKTGIIWRLLWAVSTGIAYTVRIRTVGDERLDSLLGAGRGGIMATWHGSTILPIFYCRNRGLWAIISRSKDGELQNRLMTSRGYKTIRGSSGSQGIRAFLEAARRIKEGAVVAITPDGPRGPVKVVQPGTALLADRGGCDILPVGVACARAWRLGSWDRHMLPKPFSKAVIIFGEPIRIGQCKSDEETQAGAELIGQALDRVEADAESYLMTDGKCNVGVV
jgi:lysophospholipid acyltransferase (LPLAT)-like uncharacterized protein